jgi:hypothetical protein
MIDLDMLEELYNDDISRASEWIPDLLAEVKRLQKENDLLQIAFHRAGNFGLFMRLCNDCVTVHFEGDVCPHDCEFCGEWSINIPDGKQCCEVNKNDD